MTPTTPAPPPSFRLRLTRLPPPASSRCWAFYMGTDGWRPPHHPGAEGCRAASRSAVVEGHRLIAQAHAGGFDFVDQPIDVVDGKADMPEGLTVELAEWRRRALGTVPPSMDIFRAGDGGDPRRG